MVLPCDAAGGGVSEADVSGEIAAWIELAPKARPAQRRDRLLVLRFVVLRFGGRRVALMGGVVGPPGRRVLIRRTRRISHPRPHSQLAQPRFTYSRIHKSKTIAGRCMMHDASFGR